MWARSPRRCRSSAHSLPTHTRALHYALLLPLPLLPMSQLPARLGCTLCPPNGASKCASWVARDINPLTGRPYPRAVLSLSNWLTSFTQVTFIDSKQHQRALRRTVRPWVDFPSSNSLTRCHRPGVRLSAGPLSRVQLRWFSFCKYSPWTQFQCYTFYLEHTPVGPSDILCVRFSVYEPPAVIGWRASVSSLLSLSLVRY